MADIENLTHKISLRIARYLERSGLIERDSENSYLAAGDVDNNEMNDHQVYSINYRVSIGPQKGKKVFLLQTLLPIVDASKSLDLLGKVAGFSLHAGVSAKAGERAKLERLCRYVARPPVSSRRLSLTQAGNICYELKTPYRSGTTHVIFDPLDFISKLAALIPAPRVNLTRFHGVFAPNSEYRASIVKQSSDKKSTDEEVKTEGEKRAAMTWAARLKRVFNIDIQVCEACKGRAKVIACIDDPVVIDQILTHLRVTKSNQVMLPVSRAPPVNLAR